MVARKPNVIVSIENGVAAVDVSTRKFPLAITLMDEADLHFVLDSSRRWYASGIHAAPYVVRNLGAGKTQHTELLHRVILGLTDSDVYGDHHKHNTLDNRRSELRTATAAQSMYNRRGYGSSKYSGVSWCERDSVWRAHLLIEGIRCALGSFDSEIDAAMARDQALRAYPIPFTNLNFPEAMAA